VTLCDTGPLVAILDRRDSHHARCVAALDQIPAGDMVTTWACLTEAMHLLGDRAGSRAQDSLWTYVADGALKLYETADGEWRRMRSLMKQYEDAPMDLADASLVSAAERLGTRRVFTLDHHFQGYRIDGRHTFDVIG
jgi:predicted nucleic acid-binding protein